MMMNHAHSNCSSSGCESGWTSYLESSYISTHNYIGNKNNEFLESNKKIKEEEEDLSMVSDASSGPPHEYYGPTSEGYGLPKKNGKSEKGRSRIHKQPSLLDDTASSPLLNSSNNNFSAINNQAARPSMVDFSQGYSTTNFQGASTIQEHYGFYYPSLSAAGNPQQHDQCYEEKRW